MLLWHVNVLGTASYHGQLINVYAATRVAATYMTSASVSRLVTSVTLSPPVIFP